MPSLPDPPPTGPATPPSTEQVVVPPATPAAFDAWLKVELGRLYKEVLAEPVPEAMLKLLRQPTRRR